jgi:SAM-dependent methyltransferase
VRRGGFGDYPTAAEQVIPDLGAVLVEACGVQANQRVLDVAAGSGNAAIRAALNGADVVASDLTPEMFKRGRELAAAHGVELEWREADAENLPFVDGEFDVVLSCVGVMFAPHHQASADELLRVCRPGGTIGVISWTPQGFVGEMFAVMKPYAAPAPPRTQPPPLWGEEDHVRSLFGDRIEEFTSSRQFVRVDRFARGAEFRDFFKTNYGPTVAAYRGLADQPDRIATLDAELEALADRHLRHGHTSVMDWEYLLVTARRNRG